MARRLKDPVIVPQDVLDGLEAVRASGVINMLDRPVVQAIAHRMGYHETVLWIEENHGPYTEGIFRGFVSQATSDV